jgi:hypothetical protein
MANQIRCPHCRAEFEVTEAVAEQLRDQLRREIGAEAQHRESAVAQREQALVRLFSTVPICKLSRRKDL